jgi:muramoyltetrapeptide carboxypeptidase
VAERILRRPRRAPAPASIGLFGPSGRMNREQLERSVAFLREQGHRVLVAEETTKEWRYFAGTDDERLEGFHRLLADPSLDVVMAARGGYGFTRLLSRIDWNAVAASGKAFVGFSDFTAFNCAAHACANLLTYQGPMAGADFGDGEPDAFMLQHFWSTIGADEHRLDDVPCDHGYSPRRIDGPLWGGNLSLLAHLVGTPYFPRITGGILFLEDVSEQPYALERRLFQLHHAGILGQQAAIVLGQFAHCEPVNGTRYPYSIPEVIETLRKLLPCPVLTDLPFGHVARKATLPFGATACLNVHDGSYGLRFSGYTTA